MNGRGKARAHAILISSGLNELARGVGRRNHKSIAQQSIQHVQVRLHVLNILGQDIQKEITSICAKRANSILRATSAETVCSFSWSTLADEVAAVLEYCVEVKTRQRRAVTKQRGRGAKAPKFRHLKHSGSWCVCAGILLHHRNHHMNLVQKFVLILHSGHSAKEVCVLGLKLECILVLHLIAIFPFRCISGFKSC